MSYHQTKICKEDKCLFPFLLEKGPSAYGNFLIGSISKFNECTFFSDLESITVVDDNITEGYNEEVASFLLGEVCLDYYWLIP